MTTRTKKHTGHELRIEAERLARWGVEHQVNERAQALLPAVFSRLSNRQRKAWQGLSSYGDWWQSEPVEPATDEHIEAELAELLPWRQAAYEVVGKIDHAGLSSIYSETFPDLDEVLLIVRTFLTQVNEPDDKCRPWTEAVQS